MPDLAIARLKARIERNPPDAEALIEVARLLSGRGDFAEARRFYETALAFEPDAGDLIQELARVLVKMGDLIAAQFWLSRIQSGEAVETKDKVRISSCGHAKQLIRAARQHEQAGRLDKALSSFRSAVGHAPEVMNWRLEAAEFMLSVGRYAAAEAHLEAAPDQQDTQKLMALAQDLRARSPCRRSSAFMMQLHRSAAADLMNGHAILAEPILREITLCRPDHRHAWADLRAARILLGKTCEADAVRSSWVAASPSDRQVADAVFERPVSARGLLCDLHDRFPLVAKEKALRRVAAAAELKTASDAYLVLDPGGRKVDVQPFIHIEGEPPPPAVSYTTGESFVLALDNAVVVGRGAVITQKGQIISDQFLPGKVSKYLAATDGDAVTFKAAVGKEPLWSGAYVEAPTFLCMGPGDGAYGDWLMDFVPRVSLANAAELDCRFLVSKHIPAHFVEMLQAVGVDKEKIIFQKDGRAVLYRKLYAPSWPAGIRERPMADWLNVFRRAVIADQSKGERLYLTRKHISNRPLVNEEEVCDLFLRHGFREIVPDELSLSETLKVFSNAACVVGPWGSAFESMLFCNKPPVSIALMPQYDQSYMRDVGIFMHEAGIRCGYVHGEAVGSGPANHAPWTISMAKAKRALHSALALVETSPGAEFALA